LRIDKGKPFVMVSTLTIDVSVLRSNGIIVKGVGTRGYTKANFNW